MRNRGVLTASGLLWVLAGPAGAATDPSSTLITVPCGVMDATQPNGKPDMKQRTQCPQLPPDYGPEQPANVITVEFFSGGVLLYTEQNPQFFVSQGPGPNSGLVSILVNGNGDATQFAGAGNAANFKTWYDSPVTSILNSPDITVKIYSHPGAPNPPPPPPPGHPAPPPPPQPQPDLILFQAYAPQGSALWCEHSGDASNMQQNVAGETTRAEAAETALQSSITAETNARVAADGTIANTFVHLVGTDVISGAKTFVNLIIGTIMNAINFTGPLSGDVTGTQSSTFVQGLRGIPIAAAHPFDGETLVYNAGLNQWEPRLICQGIKLDCNNNPADGCETNILLDSRNCGLCGVVCAQGANQNAFCNSGTCVTTCNVGFGDCNGLPQDGCETVVNGNDPNNCGGCGSSCGPNGVCMNGQCQKQCANGQATCNGVCTDITSDVNNCGGCGLACAASPGSMPACQGGQCVIGSCAPPFADCNKNPADGCETDLFIDSNNCGMCGNVCANGVQCNNGQCGQQGCAPGQVLCAGGCTNIANDQNNCGGCGNVCVQFHNAKDVCQAGMCTIIVCAAPFADCNKNPNDGCEVNLSNDSTNCGGCGNVCANGNACVNSQCLNQQGNCMDGIKDGNETDVDCGGGTCAACPVGKLCTVGVDCSSGVCRGSICQAPSCNDGVKNGNETDVDCGANACNTPCAPGKGCGMAADCQSGICQNGACN